MEGGTYEVVRVHRVDTQPELVELCRREEDLLWPTFPAIHLHIPGSIFHNQDDILLLLLLAGLAIIEHARLDRVVVDHEATAAGHVEAAEFRLVKSATVVDEGRAIAVRLAAT